MGYLSQQVAEQGRKYHRENQRLNDTVDAILEGCADDQGADEGNEILKDRLKSINELASLHDGAMC